MGHHKPTCPYVSGNKITFQFVESCPMQEQVVEGTIVQIFDFTLSCVMVIAPSHPHPKERLVLKLYDRRFAPQLREDNGIPPWTSEIEQEYQQSILDGRALDFLTKLRFDDNFSEIESEPWDTAQNEAYLFYRMQELYDTESEVYQELEDLQGSDIPRFLGRVSVPGHFLQSTGLSECLDCPGILLQYIEGASLRDLASFAPRVMWQHICEEAMRIVHATGHRGILNEDVRPANFIVHKVSAEESAHSYKVFMIDFALCQFRSSYTDEQEWQKSRADEDEEGAVCAVMEMRLKGGYVYHRSAEAVELTAKFKKATAEEMLLVVRCR